MSLKKDLIDITTPLSAIRQRARYLPVECDQQTSISLLMLLNYLGVFLLVVLVAEYASRTATKAVPPSIFNSFWINACSIVVFSAALFESRQAQLEILCANRNLLNTTYKDAKENYLGCAIFICYIVFALVYMWKITSSLYCMSRERSLRFPRRKMPNELVAMYAIAFMSFSTLSYNMVSFLVTSYLSWIEENTSLSNEWVPSAMWLWMTHSALFHEFALELVHDSDCRIWTQLALTCTFYSFQLMRSFGSMLSIENLHWYLILGQILPVSFSLSLFFIAVILKLDGSSLRDKQLNTAGSKSTTEPFPLANISDNAASKDARLSRRQGTTATAPVDASSATMRKSYYLHLLPMVAFYFLSKALPMLSGTSFFIPAVLLLRVALFQPWLPTPSASSLSGISQHIEKRWHWHPLVCASLILLYHLTVFIARIPHSLGDTSSLFDSLIENHAVGALGMDSVIWVASLAVFFHWEFHTLEIW